MNAFAVLLATVVADSAAPAESHPARTILLTFPAIAAAVTIALALLAHLRRR